MCSLYMKVCINVLILCIYLYKYVKIIMWIINYDIVIKGIMIDNRI